MIDVLLTDGTVGQVEVEVEVGSIVIVALHDENGLPIKATGEVAEIL